MSDEENVECFPSAADFFIIPVPPDTPVPRRNRFLRDVLRDAFPGSRREEEDVDGRDFGSRDEISPGREEDCAQVFSSEEENSESRRIDGGSAQVPREDDYGASVRCRGEMRDEVQEQAGVRCKQLSEGVTDCRDDPNERDEIVREEGDDLGERSGVEGGFGGREDIPVEEDDSEKQVSDVVDACSEREEIHREYPNSREGSEVEETNSGRVGIFREEDDNIGRCPVVEDDNGAREEIHPREGDSSRQRPVVEDSIRAREEIHRREDDREAQGSGVVDARSGREEIPPEITPEVMLEGSESEGTVSAREQIFREEEDYNRQPSVAQEGFSARGEISCREGDNSRQLSVVGDASNAREEILREAVVCDRQVSDVVDASSERGGNSSRRH